MKSEKGRFKRRYNQKGRRRGAKDKPGI